MKSFIEYLLEAKAKVKKPLPKHLELDDVDWENYIDAAGLPTLDRKAKTFWAKYFNMLADHLGWPSNKSGKFLHDSKKMIPAKYRKGGAFYRGYSWARPDFGRFLKAVKDGELKQKNLISSWSTDFKIAQTFAEEKDIGIVLNVEIPTKHIVLNIEKFVLDFNTVKIGAATPTDEFSGIEYVKKEGEILVSRSIKSTPLNGKSIAYIYVGGYNDDEYTFEGLVDLVKDEWARFKQKNKKK